MDENPSSKLRVLLTMDLSTFQVSTFGLWLFANYIITSQRIIDLKIYLHLTRTWRHANKLHGKPAVHRSLGSILLNGSQMRSLTSSDWVLFVVIEGRRATRGGMQQDGIEWGDWGWEVGRIGQSGSLSSSACERERVFGCQRCERRSSVWRRRRAKRPFTGSGSITSVGRSDVGRSRSSSSPLTELRSRR